MNIQIGLRWEEGDGLLPLFEFRLRRRGGGGGGRLAFRGYSGNQSGELKGGLRRTYGEDPNECVGKGIQLPRPLRIWERGKKCPDFFLPPPLPKKRGR